MIYMVFVPKTDITEEAFEQNILKSMYFICSSITPSVSCIN